MREETPERIASPGRVAELGECLDQRRVDLDSAGTLMQEFELELATRGRDGTRVSEIFVAEWGGWCYPGICCQAKYRSRTPPPPRARGSAYFGSSVGGLPDLEQFAQVIGADQANFADLDERERSVPHQVVDLGATQPRETRGVVHAVRKRTVVW
jgi:hypothetical protein